MTQAKRKFAIRARWLFPVAGEPIENGVVEIAKGRIERVSRKAPRGVVELDKIALLPGFVNAHAHLEFSDRGNPVGPPLPFTKWLRAVVDDRKLRGDEPAAAIQFGYNEVLADYTVALAEIATYDEKRVPKRPEALDLILFREIIGLDPVAIDDAAAMARRFLEAGRDKKSRFPHRGLSPHAPYSVHPRLLERLADLAKEFDAPVAMHLAESKGELELLRSGTGEFVQFLQGLGVWRPELFEQPRRPLDILKMLDGLPRVLLAHANYLDDEELAFIAERPEFSVVYCPRTHFYFRHADHPWQKLLALGGRVALGTDGRASNPDLNLWNEVLFLRRRFPNHDPAVFLRMATLDGACALGLDSTLGTIEPGKSERLAFVLLGDSRSSDPYAQLFDPRSRLFDETTEIATMSRLHFPRIFR